MKKYSPSVQAALDACMRASLEDPVGFVDAFQQGKGFDECDSAKVVLEGTGKLFEAMGYARGLMDVEGRIRRIAVGYKDMGEITLAISYAKLAQKIATLVDKKIAEGEQVNARSRAAADRFDAVTEKKSAPEDLN